MAKRYCRSSAEEQCPMKSPARIRAIPKGRLRATLKLRASVVSQRKDTRSAVAKQQCAEIAGVAVPCYACKAAVAEAGARRSGGSFGKKRCSCEDWRAVSKAFRRRKFRIVTV